MTELLEHAVALAGRLTPEMQDDVARVILQLATSESEQPVMAMTPDERDAIGRSRKAADRGEFATDRDVLAVWSKHGL